MTALDPRLLKISFVVGDKLWSYTDLAMVASGCKYANALQNECEVKITNLDKATRDHLLTELSPYNRLRQRKSVRIEAGRVSTGYRLVYLGDVISASATQPPDIVLTMKSATKNFEKGDIIARAMPENASLRSIAGNVAKDLGLGLRFEANDKQVRNYSFSGASSKQVDALGQAGQISAFVDDGNLVLKEVSTPLKGKIKVLSADTGMIGIPEFTDQGVKVKMLFDPEVVLGGGLQISSTINPAASGLYCIFKLEFELASRDTAWYYSAECHRVRT